MVFLHEFEKFFGLVILFREAEPPWRRYSIATASFVHDRFSTRRKLF